MKKKIRINNIFKVILCVYLSITSSICIARDLNEIKESAVLRHIGTPYGNFVKQIHQDNTLIWVGLDVELMQGFAANLGVKYLFIEMPTDQLVGGLTGQNIEFNNNEIIYGKTSEIRGDVISNGMTTLEWRKEIVDFSDDYFFSAVWLFARADSTMQPITPSGSLEEDIKQVKLQLLDRNLLTVKQTNLDAELYDLQSTGAKIIFRNKFTRLIPSLLDNNAESTLMDVVDGLLALEKWAGEIKVVGPISEIQSMAVGFSKKSPKLRIAFNEYLDQIRTDGSYNELVEKYYPNFHQFAPNHFAANEELNVKKLGLK